MTRPERLLLGVPLLVLLSAAPALAQYMYLDTDGDGVHSVADALQPSGTTTLDLWIRTDADRDGNPMTCDTGDGDLTINSYEFILRATNGAVSWGAVTNRAAGFSDPTSVVSDTTDLHAGASGSTLPPGTYRLASIQVSPARGTPAIGIVASTGLSGTFLTGFGSQCSGLDFSNTMTLELDWFDVDGVPFGGVANAPPTIDPIPDLVVAEESSLDQPMVARDADGTPLQFVKASGQAFMTVTTVDPGAGVASGLIRLTPAFGDAGSTTGSVQVSDGITSTHAEFRITVLNLNRAPTLDQPADMSVFAGQESRQELYASDPDGGALRFLLVSGPSFVAVATIDPFTPARGMVTLTPSAYDEGTETVTVAASDGELQSERTFSVEVYGGFAAGTLLCRPYDMTVAAGSPAEQTVMATSGSSGPLAFRLVEGPPFVSLVPENAATSPQTAVLRVSPSGADAGVTSATVEADDGFVPVRETCRITVVPSLTPPAPKPEIFTSTFRSYDVCDIPQGAVLVDLNEDGLLDVITPNYGCGISVLLGIGAGQLADRRDVHLDGNPKAVEVADLDGDGDLDAAVAIGFGDRIAVLSGDGTGSFQQVNSLPAGPDAAYAAIADLNGDGILDLVGADESGNTISTYLGTGAMQFGSRRVYPAGSAPCYAAVGDFNGDGVPDVAAANENSNAVSLHLGAGGGILSPATLLGTANGPSAVRFGDFDEDGRPDIAATGFHSHFLTVLFGDGLGSFSRRLDLETGNGPWSLTTTDVNGDGHLDLVSANTGDDDVGTLLGNGDGTFRPFLRSPSGSIPRFVAGGDLNGDHHVDLVVANEIGGTISLLEGHGDGTFGSATSLDSPPSLGVAAADVTGDGLADLIAVQDQPAIVQIHPGLGGGRFGSPSTLPASGAEADPGFEVADVNRDGVADLLVPLRAESWALYLGGPSLGQAEPILIADGGRASRFEVGDWNRDGKPDVAFLAANEPRLTLLDGDGAGGFSGRRDIALGGLGVFVTSGDWDADGILDLAATIGIQGTAVLWGDGAGFTPGPMLPVFVAPTGLASGDLDVDGRSELLVTEAGTNGGIGIFRKGPHGILAIYEWTARGATPARTVYPAGSRPLSPLVADATGDGLPDILVSEGGANAIGVLPGLGARVFGPREDYGVGSGPVAVAVADLDGDGRLDAAAPSLMSGLTILTNRTGSSPTPLAARAFAGPGDRTLRLVAAKPSTCLHVEPVERSFVLSELDLRSVRLSRADSDADPIAAAPAKQALLGDTDRNGIDDVAACFDRESLRRLFADVRGARDVPLILTGALATGRTVRADLTLRVVAQPGGPPAVSVFPNPSNPRGVLRFTLSRPGRLRVTLHDVRGRTVARVYRAEAAPAREYAFPLGGDRMASGIYFYRVETNEGVSTGRFTILK